jgi:phage terminase small subunit
MAAEQAIKEDLLKYLGGLTLGPAGRDLVADYMALWSVKNELLSDIRERGVILRWENGPYASGYKRNESLPALRMVIRRMAHMRRALGLIPDGESRTRDSEEEL